MNKNKIVKYLLIFIIILIIYLILDFLNIFGFLTQKLNFEALSILVNALVVILIFFITYSLVNQETFKREEKNKNNKINLLEILLKESYSNCKIIFDILQNDELLKKYIISKVNFNKLADPYFDNMKNIPFKNEKYIVELFSDGIVNKNKMEKYFEIKSLFYRYVNSKIIFFDIENAKDICDEELIDSLDEEKQELLTKLENELKLERK